MIFASTFEGGSEKKMKLNRRQFLKTGASGVAAAVLTSSSSRAIMPTHVLRIALVHLAPIPGDLASNRRLVETAVTTAAKLGAAWIITPELCICGYAFTDQIGTDWILSQPDPWMIDFCRLVAQLQVTVFLSHPERDRQTTKLHNSVFVIGSEWHNPRQASKNQYTTGRCRVMVKSRRTGCSHPYSASGPCGSVNLCGCVFAGDCQELTNPRRTSASFFRCLGTRPSWAEW